jgi:hypothetical protein
VRAPNASTGAFSGTECTRRCVAGLSVPVHTVAACRRWASAGARRGWSVRARVTVGRGCVSRGTTVRQGIVGSAICAPPTHLRVHSRVQSAPVDALLGCAYAQRLAAVVISPRPSHTRRTILDCDTNARCTRPDASVALGIMRHRADRAGLHPVGRYLRSASLWSTNSAAGPGPKGGVAALRAVA